MIASGYAHDVDIALPRENLSDERTSLDETVLVAEEANAPRLFRRGNAGVAKVEPGPDGVGDVFEAVAGGGLVEVDQRRWRVIDQHDIPRGGVVVADDLMLTSKRGARGRIVEGTEEVCDLAELVVGPADVADVMRHRAVDVRQPLTPLRVDTTKARCACKPDLLQVPQQLVDERRTRRRWAKDHGA